MNGPGKRNRKTTVDEFLSIFKIDPEHPRACLMSAVELREKFRSRTWDDNPAPALRDECEGAGKLEVYHGARNQKWRDYPRWFKPSASCKASRAASLSKCWQKITNVENEKDHELVSLPQFAIEQTPDQRPWLQSAQ
jgi:hypothetical protein